MEKNKKTLISIITLSFILVSFGLISYTSAGFNGFGLDQEQREAMEEAVLEGDYSKWKNIKDARTKITDIITEENFSQFGEMHNLFKDGQFKEANILRDDLGLSERRGNKKFDHSRIKSSHGYINEGFKFIEYGDYKEWKKEFGDTKISEVIQTEGDFQKLLEAHNLMKEGKYIEAMDAHRELGFTKDWIGERKDGLSEKWHGKIDLDK